MHCDIKPANVLFDEAGNAYLTDFGIAVSVDRDRGDTDPRVRRAGAGRIATGDTVQSDIFSFGCMLWELLAGARR